MLVTSKDPEPVKLAEDSRYGANLILQKGLAGDARRQDDNVW